MNIIMQTDGEHVAITIEGMSSEGLAFHIFYVKEKEYETARCNDDGTGVRPSGESC